MSIEDNLYYCYRRSSQFERILANQYFSHLNGYEVEDVLMGNVEHQYELLTQFYLHSTQSEVENINACFNDLMDDK